MPKFPESKKDLKEEFEDSIHEDFKQLNIGDSDNSSGEEWS